MRAALRLLLIMGALPLAAFFAFVGWFKTFAPLATLAEHLAWTLALPVALGRSIGATELLAAGALAVGSLWPGHERWALAAALYLIANQACAALVHLQRGEAGALPQNAVLAALAAAVAVIIRTIHTRRYLPS